MPSRQPVGKMILNPAYAGPERRIGRQRKKERRGQGFRKRWLNRVWVFRPVTPKDLGRMQPIAALMDWQKRPAFLGLEQYMQQAKALFEKDVWNKMKEFGIRRERAIQRLVGEKKYYFHYFSLPTDLPINNRSLLEPSITHFLLAYEPKTDRFFWASSRRQPAGKERRKPAEQTVVQPSKK